MSAVKKTVAAGLAALTIGTATVATSSPAGAIIGSAVRPYGYGPGPYTCVRRRPVYDAYGNFAGYRPVRVC